MRQIIGAAIPAAALTGPAMAGSAFDPESGNAYRSARAIDGSTTVRGYSFGTGAAWETVIEPDGSMRGVDSAGNVWQYDARTGAYWNSDGRSCTGKGAARSCN